MKPLLPPPRDAPRPNRSTGRSRRSKNLTIDPSSQNESTMRNKVRSPISPRSASSKSTSASTRSKKILVIDPKTQKKYPLNTDDHSLTDKELLVFHNQTTTNNQYQFQQRDASPIRYPNDQNSLSGIQTLSTASALTEAEHYGGKMIGSCHLSACVMDEGREEEDDLTSDLQEDRDRGTLASPLAALTSFSVNKSLVSIASSPLAALNLFSQKGIQCKRIGIVIFPHFFGYSGLEGYDCGLKGPLIGSGNGDVGDGTLMGIRLRQCPIDFMAHVCYVGRGSLAERMGVEKGDVVTFAISLSNMNSHDPQNTHLAEKLIKRLESVGMRTSYRELFDIFLSRTTNTRPVGIVFRRFRSNPWGGGTVNPISPKTLSPRSIPHGEALKITDEFEWSTDFLRSLSVKCREYEFERYLPLKEHQVIEKDAAVLKFLPRPNSTCIDDGEENEDDQGAAVKRLSSLLDFACGINESVMSRKRKKKRREDGSAKIDKRFLSNRTLCSLMEQAVGLIFLHRTVEVTYVGGSDSGSNAPREKRVTSSGSGFVVVRKTEGEWSAPCFLEVLGSKAPSDDRLTESSESVHMIIINKKELAGRLILGNAVKFTVSMKQKRVNVLVRDAAFIANNGGKFELMNEFFAAVKVSEEMNQAFYSALTPMMTITPKDVLVGALSPPEQSIDFYGALQSLELPYSMHAHPVIPDLLQAYCTSDWSSIALPPPTSSRNNSKSSNASNQSTASGGGMKTILKLVALGDSVEDKREIDVFARRFQYYLMDGVPVHVVLATSSAKEEKILRLTIKENATFLEALLELSRKRRPGIMNVGMQGNYVATMETITKLSRTAPAVLDLDEEEKRRFFSFETDLSGGPIMMLAKSKKDAMLLLCGLKLLLEREKMYYR